MTDRPLWTTAEVARAFRAGVSSVKRWTDDGELDAVTTPGGHRRYTLTSLYRFASIRRLPTDRLPPVDEQRLRAVVPPPVPRTLFAALRTADAAVVRRLLEPKTADLAKRATFLDRVVGDALREIGEKWACGVLSVDEEHRASNLLIETVDSMRPSVAADAPVAMLACPPEELHELPLRLLRLVLEWSGWRTDYIGARLPWNAMQHAIDDRRPRILALTARSAEPFRYTDFDRLVRHAAAKRTTVIIGGGWARGGTGAEEPYLRFRTLRGFVRWLRARK